MPAFASNAVRCYHPSRTFKGGFMANLSVRKLDDELVSKLRLRAAHHGISMEEEVRRIIMQAVASPVRLGDMAVDIFGADFGVELRLEKQPPHEPMNL